MEDFFDQEISAEEKAEIRKQIDWYFQAINRIFEQMDKDHEEMDRLNAQNDAKFAELREVMRCGKPSSAS